jgi:glycerol-3-phosphate acyltransferase PlsY
LRHGQVRDGRSNEMPVSRRKNDMTIIYGLPVIAYLLGSLSAAIVVARALGIQDPREVGSKNPGATNILRYGGKLPALLTLAGDLLKGVAAVLIARALTDDALVIALSGLSAFLGHLFPVFFRLRGGKGVATALGVWLAVNPWVGLALLGTWLVLAAVFRYSSLSALGAALAAPFFVAWWMPDLTYLYTCTAMSMLLIARHRTNIRNLLAGRERKIGKTSAG